MLVLSRKRDEAIVCGELDGAIVNAAGPIVITVLSIKGDQVRLGIEAPRDVPVHRFEVAVAIAAEIGRSARESSAMPA